MILFLIKSILLGVLGWNFCAYAANQTTTVDSVFKEETLPFRIKIKKARFSLPRGLQGTISATYKGKWLLLGGRTNGLHGFVVGSPNNFPPQTQNLIVYVVDPQKRKIYSRSLDNPRSGLSQSMIDTLSVTNAQSYQKDAMLYITGGYGVDSSTNAFTTKDTLTAIHIPGLMHWVMNPSHHETAIQYIRQISHPSFKVTGGFMTQIGKNPTLLVFGQDFSGFYFDGGLGIYTKQIRRFTIHDDGKNLSADVQASLPSVPDANFRRRDLNVVPVIRKVNGRLEESLVALSGVFTETGGAWTVPVHIAANGSSCMPNPRSIKTFKQAMNNYNCATLGFYSKKSNEMYTMLFGGISFGYVKDGIIKFDSMLPFINSVTALKIHKNVCFRQYLMKSEFPVILSTQSNPGNPLLFGTGADFFPATGIAMYDNGVLKFDTLQKDSELLVGYIVGGIQSTLPNTNTASDSAASPYIFEVFLERRY